MQPEEQAASHTTTSDVSDGFDERLLQRASVKNSLETVPTPESRGYIPNTPLAASTISFALGIAFCVGAHMFVSGLYGSSRSSYQLGFFLSAWSAFHWGEFAVTAGWNREKCCVDCKHLCL
jgi:protein-S-isoprenylcysteine O-methyltransferase